MKQTTIASLAYAGKEKRTRREEFLSEMDAVVPWARLTALIEPHYPKAGPKGGRPPMPLEIMLRVYCLQQWYTLSDSAAEEALYDSNAMCRFAGLELVDDSIPDETTDDPQLPPPTGAARADPSHLRDGERLPARDGHPLARGHADRRAELDEEQAQGPGPDENGGEKVGPGSGGMSPRRAA